MCSSNISLKKTLLLLLEEHVYNEACVLETAVMLSEISIIAGSKEILSIHHFTVLVISPMRYAPAFSSPIHVGHAIYIHLYSSKNDSNQTNKKERKTRQRTQYRKYSNVHAYITQPICSCIF